MMKDIFRVIINIIVAIATICTGIGLTCFMGSAMTELISVIKSGNFWLSVGVLVVQLILVFIALWAYIVAMIILLRDAEVTYHHTKSHK